MARPPAIQPDTGTRITLNVRNVGLTDDQFDRLCCDNRDLRIEMTAEKELIIMSPTCPETDRKNAKITQRLGTWAEQDGTWVFVRSWAIFTLAYGAVW